MAFGQDGRHQHRTGVRRKGHVVVVECVSGHAIDAGRLRGRQHGSGKGYGCLGRGLDGAHMRQHDAHHRLIAAGHHGRDGVNEAGPGNVAGGLFLITKSGVGNIRCQFLG